MQFYKITLKDVSKVVGGPDEAMRVAGEMVNELGGGVPAIVPCNEDGSIHEQEEEVVVKISTPPSSKIPVVQTESTNMNPAPVFSGFGAGNQIVDKDAQVRLSNVYDKLEAGGVTGIARDTTPFGYKPGMRMAEVGYNTQRNREIEFNNLMPVSQAIDELNERIKQERRRDVEVSSGELINVISDTGALAINGYSLNEQAIRGLFVRLASNAQKLSANGTDRILALQDRINKTAEIIEKNRLSNLSPAIAKYDEMERMMAMDRAELTHCLRHELSRFPNIKLKLRTRENPDLHDIFAVLSPEYTVVDSPLITPEFLKAGIPDDARGKWSYNSDTTEWSLEIATWLKTDLYSQVIGEPVSGTTKFSGRDNGTGRLNGFGGILIIQCLNASLYSAGGVEVSRVHRGRALFDAHKMVQAALKSVNTLSEAWGNNRKIVVEPPAQVKISDILPGFYRALLSKGELAGILPGRKDNHIVGLARAFESERRIKDRLVRSDFAQGFTKYIQGQPADIQYEGEQAIGAWLAKPTKMVCDLKE